MNIEKHLSEFMATHLPIAAELGLKLENYQSDQLVLSAPLQANINDKATAFGGSIYCVCVMSCWGMVYLKAIEHGVAKPNVVVSHGEIDYFRPVASDIIATCRLEQENQFDDFFESYRERGKAKVALCSSIGEPDKPAVKFSGRFALIS